MLQRCHAACGQCSVAAGRRCDHRAMRRHLCSRAFATALAFAALLPAFAQSDAPATTPRRFERLRQAMAGDLEDGSTQDRSARGAPSGTRLIPDIPYGPDPAQRLDVYVSTQPRAGTAPLPVIFFVHGGAWARGDKTNARVVEPKIPHWVDQGYVVISANYRMLPTPVAQQADDVAAAIAFAQSQAGLWGGDGRRFILTGHSAGAHLVALIAAGARTATRPQPWRGAVLLDSAAFDVTTLMTHRHFGLYDHAFGSDRAYWTAMSPIAQLAHATAPILAVCSSRRQESCGQADRFAGRANGLGGKVRVLREDLSHREINATLGAVSDYTSQVDAFLASVR
jgi:acetyl esterase/lipase